MKFRKLEELNLLDDFLFGAMVTHPEVGEEFSRELLKILFGRKFGRLKIVPQKVFYGSDTDLHGARLDVCIEEDDELELAGAETLYDIEPEMKNTKKYMNSLPQRIRFYHALIDTRSLKSGTSYDKLKKVYIIMIMPFDPFGLNRMIYTIRNMCEEVPEMPYEDGARTIFLYTRGEEGNPSEELRQLLQYMEETTQDNAKNETLMKIHEMVRRVKEDKEVSIQYMKSWEKERMIREESEAIGEARGEALGIEKGRKLAENEIENLKKEIGRLNGLLAMAQK